MSFALLTLISFSLIGNLSSSLGQNSGSLSLKLLDRRLPAFQGQTNRHNQLRVWLR